MDSKITIRVNKSDVEQWREAAWLRKVSMALWIRSVLNATAKETVKDRETILQRR